MKSCADCVWKRQAYATNIDYYKMYIHDQSLMCENPRIKEWNNNIAPSTEFARQSYSVCGERAVYFEEKKNV